MDDIRLRGTGRTYRQLEKTPAGSVYIVHTNSMLSHARDILDRHFPEKAASIKIRTTMWVDTGEILMGLSIPIVVDHAAVDSLNPRALAIVRVHMQKWNP